ncbi:hypothetical protein EWM64_g215 [Hericium alpestre]|uniref:Uncharacterized protein n=1 Tax=Hericium alpestre TaxID=135208 RepID=A0A4Z0AB37_9AGAM|nr:hypothetical protein EWM64_g215 [Hericium alpestre]
MTTLPDDLTFIHRPPSSAPTPFSYTTNPTSPLLRSSSSKPVDAPLPPPLRPTAAQKPRLSEEQLYEMRRLRASNPTLYTRKKLAEKFNCSEAFVGLVTPLSRQQQRVALDRRDQEHERARAQWGEKKLIVREIRKKRKEFW